jgi:hypothetical protein
MYLAFKPQVQQNLVLSTRMKYVPHSKTTIKKMLTRVRQCLVQKTQVQKTIEFYKGEACASPSKLQVQKNLGRDMCLTLNHKFKILELSFRGSIIFLIMDDEKKM